MKWMVIAATAAVLAIGFQNCSSDMGPSKASDNSTAGTPNPTPNPGPAPGPGPGPGPAPGPNPQVQPNPSNAINDVKPRVAGNCPMNYGIYDLVNTTPAVSTAGWEHFTCVKPFAMGDTSVISDAQLVIGACPAGTELLQSVQPSSSATPGWNLAHSICIKRATLPVTASFVTYFYYSAPGQVCRTGDLAFGSATFCTGGNAGGTCAGGLSVSFCRALQ